MRGFMPEVGNIRYIFLLIYNYSLNPWVHNLLLSHTYKMTWNKSYKFIFCVIFIHEHGINHIFPSNHFYLQRSISYMIEGQPIWFRWGLLVKTDYFCPVCQYSINCIKLRRLRVPWQSRRTNHKWRGVPKTSGRKPQKVWLVVPLPRNHLSLKIFNPHKPDSRVYQAQLSRKKGNKKVFVNQQTSIVSNCLGLNDHRNNHLFRVTLQQSWN